MNWISVSDKLPPEGSRVLVYRWPSCIVEDAVADKAWLGGFCRKYEGVCITDVTHWMKLPKLPKGKR